MRIKGTVTVKRDGKLGMYRYLMEKAILCEDWESFEFWEKAFDSEWKKLYCKKSKKRVDK